MAEEMLMRSGLFSNLFSSGEIWLAVAYVVGMFMILGFRPQNIARHYTFRLSYIFFALFLIVPAVINSIILLSSIDGGFGRSGNGQFSLIGFQLTGLASKILLALSFVLALSSLKRHAGTGEQD